jgi:hypothetical protein
MSTILELIRSDRHRTLTHVVVILAFSYVLIILPLQLDGLPVNADFLTNVRFATAYQDALIAGQMIPSWANDNFGYGSIGIRFYPPLSGYFLAVIHLFTNNWTAAFLIALYVWLCVGCLGTYFFVRDWATPSLGLVGALLYALIPYHLAEIFRFVMYAEFCAWSIIPFCFLFLSRICRGGRWVDTLCFAIAYSVLILTHVPTTIIVSICFPIYVLLLIDWSNVRKILTHLAAGVALTLLATVFRWGILVGEVRWLAHIGQDHYQYGFYDFRTWLFPNFLAPPSPYINLMKAWFYDLSIILTLALLIPAVIQRLWPPQRQKESSHSKVSRALLWSALFAFFMFSKPSLYIWENIELLQRLQFPSRWVSVFSLLCVVLFSISIGQLALRVQKFERLVVYPAIGIVLAIWWFDVTQVIFPSSPLRRAEYGRIEDRIHAEQIWKAWWPIWAKEEAFTNLEKVVAGEREVAILSWNLETKEFVIQNGDATNVGVQLFYYPFWKATVNGRPTEIGFDTNGAITIPVSAEVSKVKLSFEEPPTNKVASVVSAITWLVPLFWLIFVYARRLIPSIKRRPVFEEEFDYS